MTTTTLPTPAEVVAAALARAKMPPEKGDIGLKGEPGRDGESIRGEKGDKGESIRGDPGRDGVDGRSMLAGEGKPGSIGKAGDLYLDTTSGAVWRRDTEWREVGNLRGADAKAAIDGRDGASIFAGVGQPIAPSNEGDLYLETNTGDLYRFDTGAWHVIGNLRGPKGETGATGRGGLFPRPGGGSSGSGLPSGGTVGQVVTNTAPGTGTWQNGSGLPSQWTDGGNGNVTATVDDIAKTAITIEALAGQTAPLMDLKNDAGFTVEKLVQELGGIGATKTFGLPSATLEVLLDSQPGAFAEVTQRITLNLSETVVGWFLDVFTDDLDSLNNFTQATLTAAEHQTSPLLVLQKNAAGIKTRIGPNGELGFFGAAMAAQQTIDAPNATPEQIANILIAYGLAVQAP